MKYTRKEFLDLASKCALGAAGYSSFDFLPKVMAREINDVLSAGEVSKVHEHIAAHKEEHIATVQRDLRQPSVSSWNKGVWEMAQLMIESFKRMGCKDVRLVPTSVPEWPGILARYDAGAAKTAVVYFMYDTQPFDEARWSSPPLEARRVKRFGTFEEVIVARGAINSKGWNRFVREALD